MNKTVLGSFAFCLMTFSAAYAQEGIVDELGLPEETEGVQSFQQNKDAWRREEEKKQTVLPAIADAIGKSALNNMEDAEQVFCYTVENKPDNFGGYTLDGFAVTGFCGVLSKEQKQNILQTYLMSEQNVELKQTERCIIQPKIMLRFMRGVDTADMLISAPCYSYSVFYGGKVTTFNIKPAEKLVEDFVSQQLKKKTDFVSPALLDQLLPVGVAQTPEQKELISKRQKPIRGWEEGKPAPQEPEKKGWNNINLQLK